MHVAKLSVHLSICSCFVIKLSIHLLVCQTFLSSCPYIYSFKVNFSINLSAHLYYRLYPELSRYLFKNLLGCTVLSIHVAQLTTENWHIYPFINRAILDTVRSQLGRQIFMHLVRTDNRMSGTKNFQDVTYMKRTLHLNKYNVLPRSLSVVITQRPV